MKNFNLKIEIDENSLDGLDYQLDRIKQGLREGYNSGESWDLTWEEIEDEEDTS